MKKFTAPNGGDFTIHRLAADSLYGQIHIQEDTDYLSPNNPYVVQLENAENKTDYKRLYTQAIQWEANQVDYQQQLSDQRKLRDEERFYNSEAQQAQRMRAAGLNPDTLGLSGGSSGSGGGVSTPSMVGTDLAELNTPVENAQTASSVISSTAGLISSVTGGISSITGTIQSIRNFDNVLRGSSASAGIAEAQEQLANATVPQQSVMSKLGLATKLAEVFPFKQDDKGASIVPTLEELTAFSKRFGIDDEAFPGLLNDVISNPKYKSLYDKLQLESNQSHARVVNRSLDFFNKFEEFQVQLDAQSQRIQFHSGQFQERYNALMALSDVPEMQVENTEKALGVESEELDNRAEMARQYSIQLKRDAEAFQNSLLSLAEDQKEIEDLLAKYTSDAKFMSSAEGVSEVARLNEELSLVKSLGSQQIQSLFPIMHDIYGRLYVNQGAGLLTDSPGSGLDGDWTQKSRNILNWYKQGWTGFVADPDRWGSMLNKAVDAGLGLLETYLGSKGSKTTTTTTRGLSSTTTVTQQTPTFGWQ